MGKAGRKGRRLKNLEIIMRNILYNLKHSTEYLNYGRDIVLDWVTTYCNRLEKNEVRILDMGFGSGADLLNIKANLPAKKLELFGVDTYQPNIEKAKKNGIDVFSLNIEDEAIPVRDEFFDVVIANQIIEHTKEIFWIFSEISRVLEKEGIAVIGVPNLAALHNRVLLMLGQQPASIELLSAHVRGFTRPSFRRFVTADGYFEVVDFRGSNFYPFPPAFSKILSRLFPAFAVCIFFLVKRTKKEGEFIDVLKTRFYETPYFRGDGVRFETTGR